MFLLIQVYSITLKAFLQSRKQMQCQCSCLPFLHWYFFLSVSLYFPQLLKTAITVCPTSISSPCISFQWRLGQSALGPLQWSPAERGVISEPLARSELSVLGMREQKLCQPWPRFAIPLCHLEPPPRAGAGLLLQWAWRCHRLGCKFVRYGGWGSHVAWSLAKKLLVKVKRESEGYRDKRKVLSRSLVDLSPRYMRGNPKSKLGMNLRHCPGLPLL